MAVVLPAANSHPSGVPRVGDMFWVDTTVYGGNKKPTRPVVVVRVPNDVLPDALVVTRTSMDEMQGRHVKHPADPGLALDRDGAFAKLYQRRIDVRFFAMPQYVRYQGQLPEPYLGQVLQMVGMA
ncbi:hypothetical protein ACFWN2_25815 [Lentzea sp. NPDC058436]|uniref:hypothetical protein n=1 Tax=Lentzea sp. NPDC058436 TaxID=3346499 RepID=UPI00366A459E